MSPYCWRISVITKLRFNIYRRWEISLRCFPILLKGPSVRPSVVYTVLSLNSGSVATQVGEFGRVNLIQVDEISGHPRDNRLVPVGCKFCCWATCCNTNNVISSGLSMHSYALLKVKLLRVSFREKVTLTKFSYSKKCYGLYNVVNSVGEMTGTHFVCSRCRHQVGDLFLFRINMKNSP